MTKKRPAIRRPGVQASTINTVAKMVGAAQSAEPLEHELRYVALSKIKLWEDQPRTVKLTMDDVIRGRILPGDPDEGQKTKELSDVVSMGLSQAHMGLINPPIAFALPGADVQLIGGQTRTMGAVFRALHVVSTDDPAHAHEVQIQDEPDLSRLDSDAIEVKVYPKRPSTLELLRLGMADNTLRKDLPIGDKLRWGVKFADLCDEQGVEFTRPDLMEIMLLSNSQAHEWLSVLKERGDPWIAKLMDLAAEGRVAFNKVAQIARLPADQREDEYHQLVGGRPVQDGSRAARIPLGKASSLTAVRELILRNVSGPAKKEFENVDWASPKDVRKAFSDFLAHWEKKYAE